MLLLFEFLDIILLLVMIVSFIIFALQLYFFLFLKKLSICIYCISFDRNVFVITHSLIIS